MSATPVLIGLSIGGFVIVITWAFWNHRNGKNKKEVFETLDQTLLGLLALLIFILGLYLACFI